MGRCLAPTLTTERREALARDLARPALRWEALLAEANRQHATPLWYARLKAHDLLPLLPDDLARYLAALHDANRGRNRMLQDELGMILDLFGANGIPVTLLKGAAVFADKLYDDPGDRLMSDLDLLVPEAHLVAAERLLMMEGYVDDPTNTTLRESRPGNQRHSHLPGLLHLRRRIAVELHYKVAYGHGGRILTVERVCSAAVSGAFRGRSVAWLAPQHRLLHNAFHATLPHREFFRGRIRLSDLAEFAALTYRYADTVDPGRFWATIRRHGLETPVGSFVQAARRLMHCPFAGASPPPTRWHQQRLLGASPPATRVAAPAARIRNLAWRTVSRVYDLANLPSWTWRNVCFGDAGTPTRARLGCIAGLLLKPRTFRNVFGR